MIDVHFDEMDRDWHAVMRRIYRFLDLDIVPAEAGMAAYMTRSERDRRFRSHSYRLASFGLDAGDIRESFGDYLSNFAVAGERLGRGERSEEHTSELQSLMRNSYAVFCL